MLETLWETPPPRTLPRQTLQAGQDDGRQPCELAKTIVEHVHALLNQTQKSHTQSPHFFSAAASSLAFLRAPATRAFMRSTRSFAYTGALSSAVIARTSVSLLSVGRGNTFGSVAWTALRMSSSHSCPFLRGNFTNRVFYAFNRFTLALSMSDSLDYAVGRALVFKIVAPTRFCWALLCHLQWRAADLVPPPVVDSNPNTKRLLLPMPAVWNIKRPRHELSFGTL